MSERISRINLDEIEELMKMGTDGPFDPERIRDIVPTRLTLEEVRHLGSCIVSFGGFEGDQRRDKQGRLVEMRVLEYVGDAAILKGDEDTYEHIAQHLDYLKEQGVAGSGSAASKLRKYGIAFKKLNN